MKERRNLLFQMQTVAIKGCRNANPRLHLQKTTLFPHIVFYNKKNRMGHRWPIRIMKKKGGLGTFLRGESFGAPLISMVTISSGLKDIGRGLFTARQFIYKKGGGSPPSNNCPNTKKREGEKVFYGAVLGRQRCFYWVLLCLDNNMVFFLCQSVVIRIVVFHKCFLFQIQFLLIF